MRNALLVVAVLSPLAVAPPASASDWFEDRRDPTAPLDMPRELVPGRALVRLHGLEAEALREAGARGAGARKELSAIEARTGVRLELVRPSLLGWGLFEVRAAGVEERPSEALTRTLLRTLADDPAVADASEDRWYRTFALPNDPGVDDMWHLDASGVPAAWDVTTGLSSQRVGVVDTGTLRNHEDLAAKDVTGWDFISSGNAAGDGNGRDADYLDEGDGADCGGGYEADSWHGSHVAGTALAVSDNGKGIAGVNQAAGLVTARAMGKCGGALSDIMEGAAWMAGANIDGVPAVGDDKVSVMNLSLGGNGGCSNYEQDVIDFITQQGVVFVAAAGNNGGAVGSPGNCTGVITVAAHGPGQGRPLAPYSSFGGTVEVVAPGGFLQSSQEQGVLSLAGPQNDVYTWQQGTSMAAPHVAGAISLLQVFDPSLTRADLAQLFTDNGDPCTGCGGVRALRVDLLLAAVGDGAAPPVDEPPPPPAEDDDYEDNGSFEQAASLACDVSLDLFMAPGDLDWFLVTPTAGAELQVDLDAGAQDLDLFIADGPTSDDVVASSTTETGQESLSLPDVQGTIAIVVAPWEEASGSYALEVRCPVPDVDDPAEEEPTEQVPGEPVTPTPPPTSDDEEPAPTDDDPAAEPRAGARAAPGGSLEGGCSQAGALPAPAALALFLLLVGRRRSLARGREGDEAHRAR